MPPETTQDIEDASLKGRVLHDTAIRNPRDLVLHPGAKIGRNEALANVEAARRRMMADEPDAGEVAEEAPVEPAAESVAQDVQVEQPVEGGETVTQEPATQAAPAATPTSEGRAFEAQLAEMERRHQAERDMDRDSFQRQLDILTQVASGRQQQAGPDEPPVDLDVTPSVGIRRLENEVAQIRAREAQREHQGRVAMVTGHVTELFGKSAAFKGKTALTGELAERIRDELFADPNVKMGNWQAEAAKRVAEVEARLGPELAPAKQPAVEKAAAVKRVLAAKVNAIPTGAGSSTPGAGMPEPKPPRPGTPEFKDFALKKWAANDAAAAR